MADRSSSLRGMFALELVNTAIEHTVDLMTEERHPLAESEGRCGRRCLRLRRDFGYDWVDHLLTEDHAIEQYYYLLTFLEMGVKMSRELCKI